MDDYSTGIRYTTGTVVVLGLGFCLLSLVLALRYKKDDKFCVFFLYATLIGNCFFLSALALSSGRVEIEGQNSVHFNYGLCCFFGERTCNVAGAVASQGSSFFPLMMISSLFFRFLLVIGYSYKPQMAGCIILLIYLLTLPKFIFHLISYTETANVAGQLSQRLNAQARGAVSYALQPSSLVLIAEEVYGYVPPSVTMACCIVGSVAIYKLSTDWDSYGSRAQKVFNGLLTTTIFDCFFISLPYLLIDMDLSRQLFSMATQQHLIYFKQHFIALSWAAHGLLLLLFVPFLRRFLVAGMISCLKRCKVAQVDLADSDADE